MTAKEQILCLDVIQGLRDRFIYRGWITVSDKAVHSALVLDNKVGECMHDYQWDLLRGHGAPSVNLWSDGSYEYVRNNEDVEPFVIYRDRYGTHPAYVELSEEFRLFCGIHEKYKSEDEREFITIDENGNKDVVAVIKGIQVKMKAKLLRSYLAARRINLLIFIDIKRYSENSFFELGIKPVQNEIVNEENLIYNYTSLIGNLADGNKSGGWVMGKCLLRYNTDDFDADQYPYFHDETYEEFIIGYDKNGDERSYTCNERQLSNYFMKRDDAPLAVIPVFFRKAVLDKYYKDPSRYQVTDGCIYCEGVWDLRVDNDQRDYAIVILGDLGGLPHEEQLYWKGYNIAPPPDAKVSNTAFARWYVGRSYNPEFPDLKFKYQFKVFNESWGKKYAWPLFLPLAADDEHRFKTLHCLTQQNNPSDFEEQILSMTKILIDSLNEDELVKSIDETNSNVQARLKSLNASDKNAVKGGISKFELFLLSEEKDIHDSISFLRNLQELRSSTTAHRKSRGKKKSCEDYFQMGIKTQQEVLEDIFCKGIEMIAVLKKLVWGRE
ncbi:hypothetical protein [Prevotella aff. ruminicola Tc2-24]|nr:hypothetical protein [Prevotella aff. ruminicola Tc2-24]